MTRTWFQPSYEWISQQLGGNRREEICPHLSPVFLYFISGRLTAKQASLCSWLGWDLIQILESDFDIWLFGLKASGVGGGEKKTQARAGSFDIALQHMVQPLSNFGTLSKKLFLSKEHIHLLTSCPESVLFQSDNKVLQAPMAAKSNQDKCERQMNSG